MIRKKSNNICISMDDYNYNLYFSTKCHHIILFSQTMSTVPAHTLNVKIIYKFCKTKKR